MTGMHKLMITAVLVLLGVLSGLTGVGIATAADETEDTMLMFVGETQPVVTVASRTPEAPTTAPAIVTVVGREEIARKGYQTLAELLADQPGFFMAAGGRGSVPYLRGLRDSILFLYDGVPMTTDVTKSFAPLDREISLSAVSRVEIVRGPGSILWGPDAFAGVVNIVPLTGRQQSGAEAGLLAGTDDLLGGGLSWGIAERNWDAFLSLNGSRERFWQPDYLSLRSDGEIRDKEVDPSEYTELTGTLNYGDWLRLSGRWSDFTRRYSMRDEDNEFSWEGSKETPVNQVKVTLSKVLGASHYTLTGYYQETDYQIVDSDIERSQRNRVVHGELLWDHRVLSRGLLTLGASWRRNAVDGALIRDGFLPDFIEDEVPIFPPTIGQADFDNTLTSVFGQFRHQWGESEWWAGLRYDDHSQYESTVSYSLGFQRPLSESLHFKASYGTAFRSPYSSQLFNDQQLDPESIQTASAQLAWTPAADRSVELTLFHSRVKDHRAEDPYIKGGLSLASDRELYGAELSGRTPLTDTLSLSGNVTVIGGSDEDENFRGELFCFVRPDGSRICVYDEWDEPADQGPGWLANLGVHWRLGTGHSLDVGASLGDRFDYSYKKGTVEGDYSQPLLVNLSYRRPGFLPGRDSFTLRITNLFDRDYRQPDIYGPVDGPPLQASLLWQLGF